MRTIICSAALAFVVLMPRLAMAQDLPALRLNHLQHVAILPISLQEPEDRILIESDAALQPDGSLLGHAVTMANGQSGVLMKRFVSALQQKPIGSASEHLMAQQMLSGALTALEPRFDADKLSVRAEFLLSPTTNREGARALFLQPGPRFVKPAYVQLVTHLREKVPGPAACPHQSVQQRTRIRLPSAYPAITLPPEISIQLGTTSYHARYRREGDVLHLERYLLIDTGRATCSVEKLREIAPVIHAAAHDFNRRIALP